MSSLSLSRQLHRDTDIECHFYLRSIFRYVDSKLALYSRLAFAILSLYEFTSNFLFTWIPGKSRSKFQEEYVRDRRLKFGAVPTRFISAPPPDVLDEDLPCIVCGLLLCVLAFASNGALAGFLTEAFASNSELIEWFIELRVPSPPHVRGFYGELEPESLLLLYADLPEVFA